MQLSKTISSTRVLTFFHYYVSIYPPSSPITCPTQPFALVAHFWRQVLKSLFFNNVLSPSFLFIVFIWGIVIFWREDLFEVMLRFWFYNQESQLDKTFTRHICLTHCISFPIHSLCFFIFHMWALSFFSDCYITTNTKQRMFIFLSLHSFSQSFIDGWIDFHYTGGNIKNNAEIMNRVWHWILNVNESSERRTKVEGKDSSGDIFR